MQKIKQVLRKPFFKRNNQQMASIMTIIAKYFKIKEMNTLKFIIFYLRYHQEQTFLTKQVSNNAKIFLLQGVIKIQQKIFNKNDNQFYTTQKIIKAQQEVIIQKPDLKIYLQTNSIAISINQNQYNNCMMLQNSSLQQQMQYMYKISYFEKLSRKSVLYLLYFCQIKSYCKYQNLFSNKQSEQKIGFVRKGQFQIKEIAQLGTNLTNKKIRSNIQILKVYQGQFFGNPQTPESSVPNNFIVTCSSIDGLVYFYEKSFFQNFSQRFSFQKIKLYQGKIEQYIINQSNHIKNIRQSNIQLLTQVKFIRKIQTPKKSLPNLLFKQIQREDSGKCISSRQRKSKESPFEQMNKLQYNKQKCLSYQKLKQPLKTTKNQIMYEFFKNNWQYTHSKYRISR